MKTTIDAAGRIVVPKPLRQALGLKPGQPLEIRAGDGLLEIEIAPTPMRLTKRGKGVVAVPGAELPPLTAAQVREQRVGPDFFQLLAVRGLDPQQIPCCHARGEPSLPSAIL